MDNQQQNGQPLLPADFDWQLQGRVVLVDNGANLPRRNSFNRLMALDSFATVCFDPLDLLNQQQKQLQQINQFQLVTDRLLGDGHPTVLFACLNNERSGTLPPLAAESLPESQREGAAILAKLGVNTLRLDAIDGLPRVDWLLLDDRHDNIAILANSQRLLQQMLLVEVCVAVEPSRDGQANLGELVGWMRQQGFEPYRFDDIKNRGHFNQTAELNKVQFTQLTKVNLLFIPTPARLMDFTHDQLTKLAFLLDTVYGVHDVPASVLGIIDEALAKVYLISRGYVNQFTDDPDVFPLTADYCPAPWETLEVAKYDVQRLSHD